MRFQLIGIVLALSSALATPACAQDSFGARSAAAASNASAGASAAAATSAALAGAAVGLSVAVPLASAADIARSSASGVKLPLGARIVAPGPRPDEAVRQ